MSLVCPDCGSVKIVARGELVDPDYRCDTCAPLYHEAQARGRSRRGWTAVACGLGLFALAVLMVIRGWDVEIGPKGDDENFSLFLCVGFAAIALVGIGLPMVRLRAAPRRSL